MISFDINTRIGKLRYQTSMERQAAIFERFAFRKLKRYFIDQYTRIARSVRNGVTNVDAIIFESNKMFSLLMNIYNRVAVTYSEMFAEGLDKTRGKSLVDVFWEYFRNFAKMYSANRAQTFNKTTKKRINRIINKGLAEHLTVRQITANINKLKKVDSMMRAQRIAITEIHTMSSKTMQDMAKSENIVTEKEWSTANDERVREHHNTTGDVFADSGQPIRVKVNEPFHVGGELLDYPGDPKGSGGNIINCRCVALYHTNKIANDSIWRN